MPNREPIIAIVGRPNVGKSTLFNRLSSTRDAIVENKPGITRDRLYRSCEWGLIPYRLVDTGGYDISSNDVIVQGIRTQCEIAIEEADALVFVVDIRVGIHKDDEVVAQILRKTNKPVYIAANKADTISVDAYVGEFYKLGLGEVYPISAEHGRGLDAIMDTCFEQLGIEENMDSEENALSQNMGDQQSFDQALADYEAWLDVDEDERNEADVSAEDETAKQPEIGTAERPIRVAVIGRPNVGKSSFVNRILGEERAVVSNIPGTTMDAIDSLVQFGETYYQIIDTAGVRRKRKIEARYEQIAVASTLNALDRADIAVVLLDVAEGVTEQDLKVAAFAHEKGRAVLLVVNKWDLAREHEMDVDKIREEVDFKISFLDYAPLFVMSAKTGKNVKSVLEAIKRYSSNYFRKVTTSQLNRVLADAQNKHQSPVHRNKRFRGYFSTQVKAGPPTFLMACNDPKCIHFSYKRYLINQLREHFDFEGTPIHLILRAKKDQAGRLKNLEARARSRRKARELKKKKHK